MIICFSNRHCPNCRTPILSRSMNPLYLVEDLPPAPIYDNTHQCVFMRDKDGSNILRQFRNIRVIIYQNDPNGNQNEVPIEPAQQITRQSNNEMIQDVGPGQVNRMSGESPIMPPIPISTEQASQSSIRSNQQRRNNELPSNEIRSNINSSEMNRRAIIQAPNPIILPRRRSSALYMRYERVLCIFCNQIIITNEKRVVCAKCMHYLNG